jgi:alpha-L-fucosidase 2
MLKHSGSYQIVMSGQGGCYYNLWDSHSPFQIDGNFGYTSGVAEMLLQSYDGEIHLLPALPAVWKNGHVNGLKAIGDFIVDQEWTDGAFAGATITNNQGQPLTFTVGSLPTDKTIDATVNGLPADVQRHDNGSFSISDTKAGDIVKINVIDKSMVGIRQPHADTTAGRSYNLSGIPVDDSYKGLVIQDHKVVLKR